jgi:hypothetical protein
MLSGKDLLIAGVRSFGVAAAPFFCTMMNAGNNFATATK